MYAWWSWAPNKRKFFKKCGSVQSVTICHSNRFDLFRSFRFLFCMYISQFQHFFRTIWSDLKFSKHWNPTKCFNGSLIDRHVAKIVGIDAPFKSCCECGKSHTAIGEIKQCTNCNGFFHENDCGEYIAVHGNYISSLCKSCKKE